MDFAPASTYMALCGRIGRIYASPHFVRVGGLWQPIRSVVGVARDAASGAYRVTLLGSDDWIEFRPHVRPKGQLIEAVAEPKGSHFGDIIRAATAGESVRYDVAFSGGVEPCEKGWRFKAAEGVEVGLFVHDWLRRFGADRVTLAPDRAELDLAEHLAALESAGTLATASVNLDPTTIFSFSDFCHAHQGNETWAGARTAASSSGQWEGNYTFGYDCYEDGARTHTIARVAFRFLIGDDIPEVVAYLRFYGAFDQDSQITRGGVCRTVFPEGLYPEDPATYGRIKTHTGGLGFDGATAVQCQRESSGVGYADLTAIWEADPTPGIYGSFDLGLFEWQHDKVGLDPGDTYFYCTLAEGEDPYLEWEQQPPQAPTGSKMTLMMVGAGA